MRAATRFVAIATLGAALPAAAACPPPFAGTGDATYYDTSAGIGQCGLPWTGDEPIAAMNPVQWDGSAHCGECLRLTGPLGTTVARVVDKCAECPSGALDLSPGTFAAIADPTLGRVPIQWERVDCPVSGDLRFFHRDGASEFLIDLTVRNHRQGVQSLAILDGGVYRPAIRADFNAFRLTASAGTFAFPVQVRVTSTAGEVLEQTVAFPGASQEVAGSAQFGACGPSIFGNGFE